AFAIPHHHADEGAEPGETGGGGFAEAGIGAGDEGGFAGENVRRCVRRPPAAAHLVAESGIPRDYQTGRAGGPGPPPTRRLPGAPPPPPSRTPRRTTRNVFGARGPAAPPRRAPGGGPRHGL